MLEAFVHTVEDMSAAVSALPTASPSAFITREGDTLPSHSVFLDTGRVAGDDSFTQIVGDRSYVGQPPPRSNTHEGSFSTSRQQAWSEAPVAKSWDPNLSTRSPSKQKASESLRWSHEDVMLSSTPDRVPPSIPRARTTFPVPPQTVESGLPPTGVLDRSGFSSHTPASQQPSPAKNISSPPVSTDPFDEVPLPVRQPQSFDDLLAKALAQGENLPGPANGAPTNAAPKEEKPKTKFLKRNSRNWYKPPPPAKKPTPKAKKTNVDSFTLPPPPKSPPEDHSLSSSRGTPQWLHDKTDAEVLDEFQSLEKDTIDADDADDDNVRRSKDEAFLSLLSRGKDEPVAPPSAPDQTEMEEETWGEISASPPKIPLGQQQQQQHVVSAHRVEVDDYSEESESEVAEEQAAPEPTRSRASASRPGVAHATRSPLVQKFFPRSTKRNSNAESMKAVGPPKEASVHIPDHVVKRLQSLEGENAALKEGMEKLRRQRKMVEKTVAKLRQERVDMEREVAEEKEKLETWKKQESIRLKKERRVLDRQARAQYQAPNRKDRAEIDTLNATLTKMKMDVQKKDAKNKLNIKRLQDRNAHLSNRITELENDLRLAQEQVLSSRWESKNPRGNQVRNLPKRNSSAPAASKHAAKEIKEQLGFSHEQPPHLTWTSVDDEDEDSSGEFLAIDGDAILGHGNSAGIQWFVNSPVTTSSPSTSNKAYNPERYGELDTEASFTRANDSNAAPLSAQTSPNRLAHQPSREVRHSKTNLWEDDEHEVKLSVHTRPVPKKAEVDASKVPKTVSSSSTQAEKKNAAPSTTAHTTTSKSPNKMPEKTRTEECETIEYADGKREKRYPNGRRYIWFRNGTEKEIHPDGSSMVKFGNGDIKRSDATSGTLIYYYAEARTTHTTYADGLELFEFPNQQKEKHFPDGTKEIEFVDGTVKFVYANGEQLSIFPDGTQMMEDKDGVKKVL